MAALTGLPDLASATWHCKRELDQATALAGGSRTVPVAIVNDARAIRSRMLKVLEYHFEKDEAVAPRVAFVHGGTRNMDLANDLQSLAALYEDPQVKPIIEADRRFYDAKDVDASRTLASLIFESLGIQLGPGRRLDPAHPRRTGPDPRELRRGRRRRPLPLPERRGHRRDLRLSIAAGRSSRRSRHGAEDTPAIGSEAGTTR